MCISVFGPSSSPSNSFVILLSIRLFCYVFFIDKIVRFLLHPGVGMFSCYLLPVVGRIFFHCFGKSRFVCIVLPFVNITLIFLLSPVPSGLFPQVVLLLFLVLPFPFCSYMFQRLSFILSCWPVSVDFFYLSFQSNFPSWFWFFLRAFWVDPNFLTN